MKYITSIFIAAFFISCFSPQKNGDTNSDQKRALASRFWGRHFSLQGHRGCRGLMPENTIPAILKAIDLGVNTLEIDISFSKDKKVLLSHEPFFNHDITTTPDGSFITEKEEKNYNLYQMDYRLIAKFDVGMKPHPRFPQQEKLKAVKPLLADVFDSVVAHRKQEFQSQGRSLLKLTFPYYFNIETKTKPETDNIFHPAPPEFVELLMAVIKEKNMHYAVTIQSFDFRTLQYLHQHYPKIKTAMLIEDFDKRSLEEQIAALGFKPTVYSPAYSLVTAELIKKCHNQKIKVIPWTVNDRKEMERLKGLGVDGIISDYPNLFNE
jgi:glycerophosphoryl diester phosphodiesterase